MAEAANVVASPIAPATPATWLALRNETAWLLDTSPTAEPAVAAAAGKRTTCEDPPEGPSPFTPRLQAAAAEAPATRPASTAARMGDRYIAGAEVFMTASDEGPRVRAGGTPCPARSSRASSSRVESPGVAAVRRDLNSRRSPSAAARQPGQIETCWSQARSVEAQRLRSAYGLSISSRWREATTERPRMTWLTGFPGLPVPTRSPDGPESERQSCSDRGRDARETHEAANDPGECASGPCRA